MLYLPIHVDSVFPIPRLCAMVQLKVAAIKLNVTDQRSAGGFFITILSFKTIFLISNQAIHKLKQTMAKLPF